MTLGALGMLSGATTWAFGYVIIYRISLPNLLESVLYILGPGLVFGLIIGSLLRLRGKVAGWHLLGYVVSAALSGSGAIYASFYFYYDVFNLLFRDAGPIELAIIGIVRGLVWSVLLGLASIPLLRIQARAALGLPVAIGITFGLLDPIRLLDNSHWGSTSFLLSTLRPGAYAASLAPVLRPAA